MVSVSCLGHHTVIRVGDKCNGRPNAGSYSVRWTFLAASHVINFHQAFLSGPVFNDFPRLSLNLQSGMGTATLGVRGKKVEGESHAKVVLLAE